VAWKKITRFKIGKRAWRAKIVRVLKDSGDFRGALRCFAKRQPGLNSSATDFFAHAMG
jgi:hypothetical protein